jgi:hypothetical protein
MSFIRLSREPGFHYLAEHAFIERSPTFESVLEAQCVIQSVTGGKLRVAPLNVPLADFATFPIGSVFGNTKANVKRSPNRRRSKRRLLLNGGFESWQADQSIEVRPRQPMDRWTMRLPSNRPVLLNENNKDIRLGMAFGEQFRFVCSSVSLLLDTISLTSYAAESPLESAFVDMNESGFTGDGTLVITPYRAYQNVSATLQVALLMSEPSLADYLKTVFLDLRLRVARGEEAMPGMIRLAQEAECTVESETLTVVNEAGDREKVDLCDRIVADHRSPNFKEIVVRVRSSRADDQIEMLRALMLPEEKERQRIASTTKFAKYPQSSKTPTRLARLQSEFGRLFPSFGAVKVRFDREYVSSTTQRQNRPVKCVDFAAPVASVGPTGGDPKTPNVKPGPTETKPFERPAVSERFLRMSDEPGLIPVIATLEQMAPIMRTFLEAAYHLDERIAHDQLPPVELARGEERLFELPASWGGFAKPDDADRTRLIAAFPLRFDQGIVWAIEIMRRHAREEFAMGLCAPLEHDDGFRMLGRIMAAVCQRVGRKRDGDLPGTFPRADFDDIRIDNVRHSEIRSWDSETLSEVLRSRAYHLLSPSRRF